MISPLPTHPRELARRVHDEPRWIDLKGLLLSGRCSVWHERDSNGGFVAGSWDFPFASLFGHPPTGLVATAVAASRASHRGRQPAGEWQLLAPPESRSIVAAALPSWRRRGIALHRWEGRLGQRAAAPGTEILVLPEGHGERRLAFDEFPVESRRELALDWVAGRPIALALAASRPVAYCWASFTTDRLWDVAIETAEPFRRRGLAAACFLALAEHMAQRSLTPAWGAMLDNPGSLGLAAKLGFVRDALLDGWSAKA